jgi:hypothetical protein
MEIFDHIISKSTSLLNGCIIWEGLINYNRPRLSIRNKGKCVNIDVNKYLSEYLCNNKIKRSDNYVKICSNNRCIQVLHTKIISRKKNELKKDDIWNRLLSKSEIEENNNFKKNCLIWTGLVCNTYGQIKYNSVTKLVHRVSYWINSNYKKYDDIPKYNENNDRLVIRHLCNNKLCFEPTHLEIGTDRENLYDDKLIHGTLLRGNSHPSSKLDEDIIRQIRTLLEDKTQKEISLIFNISQSTISSIKNGYLWGHIPDSNNKIYDIRRKKDKDKYDINKNVVWTKEMFEIANKKILDNIKINKIENNFVNGPCHEWTQQVDKRNGYGIIYCYGKRMRTHILSCEIKENKHRPKNMITRHLCGNKICCNPDHLEFGSSSENNIDTIIHNRSKNIKLNIDIVKLIRCTYKDKSDISKFANQYNVSTSTIRDVINRKSWKFVH